MFNNNKPTTSELKQSFWGSGSVVKAVASDTNSGSNPVSANFYIEHLFNYCQLYRKDENEEKERPGMVHLKLSF